ncbi:MAG: PIN domain-containing protein [Deltaproteobacteria bacterium]|nr:PIN domain-containing protein [Deltaproteobacteria bacterium]
MTSRDAALLDTNVLVYAMNEDAQHHAPCRALRDRALRGAIRVCIAPQVLLEYYSVVTSPRHVSTPLSGSVALSDVEKLATSFPLIHPPHDLHDRVFQLLHEVPSAGGQVFDVALAATMLAHGVSRIYTYDARFARLPGLVVLTP